MPVSKTRKTTAIPKKKTIEKRDTKQSDLVVPITLKKKDSLNNLCGFLLQIINEPEGARQQSLISEYSEKVAAADVLGLPVDEIGHVRMDRLTSYEEEILEKTAVALTSCINSLIKHRKHLKDLRGKVIHARSNSPFVPLEYPKKVYKTKYKLRLKYIK